MALGEYLDQPKLRGGPHANTDPKDQAENESAILLVAAQTAARIQGRQTEIVIAKAYLDVDKLPPGGGTCEIILFLDVQEGWHINANPAQPKNLIPTKFTLTSQTGITLENVTYPKGKPFAIDGFDERAMVYEDKVILRGRLRIPADVKNAAFDPLEIKIRYQPCNDKQCLAPKSAKLTGRVAIAAPGEQVKTINQNLFPKPVVSPK